MSSKTVLSSGKNVLIGELHQMESTLKGLKFKHIRITTQFFYLKIPVLGGPPLYKHVHTWTHTLHMVKH